MSLKKNNAKRPADARSIPTLQDVAERAGVSTATVSRCLNSPDLVVDSTRDRVMKAVRELGYAPNYGAQILAAKRTNTIGAIIPTMENAIFARGLQAFQEELGRHGQTLLVASSAYRQDLEAEQIRNLVARGADALLLIGHDRMPEAYDFLDRRALPYLVAWTFNPEADRLSIGFNNRVAMRDFALEVLQRGHRRIAIITADPTHNDRARERVEGIAEALESYDLDPATLQIIETNYSIENGATAFRQLMEGDYRPTAVMCGNDVLAVGALDMARQMGIAVPEAVSITGFDDIELAQISTPRLTTVHVPHREMGRRAAEILIRMLGGADPGPSTQLQTQIMLRETLGPVRLGA
ncbi:MAG: LacI family DNA-binding transcriptional regulator [Rhizobiales bacterium]|nr:LacI family DNA-binding transcriptional regulator [Hyphomicrobiales bacterium]MBO6697587.1 LacI family DNA-binding transcriptional regulator [Hyphomicrobiales bacterium]MBO6736158.1 LacI family DNA-binding transcriptional regulator [Hyphomicrobiales bacterium]MBO6912628.1 LacI family DNA-binding transcriptional regulator [Hyphomicrobiales bacterium]MBO6957174.1 LacI family DNA-binding transcriptional regulator [Hyphomicrobiales bacterium]